MAREEVPSEVTGNPFITGIYDMKKKAIAFEGKIKLTLTNSGVGEGSWSYTLSGLDAEGNELTKTDNLPIRLNGNKRNDFRCKYRCVSSKKSTRRMQHGPMNLTQKA